jgi:protein phosphatase
MLYCGGKIMKVFYTSNIGRKKSNNEDSLLINKKIISESSFDLVLKEEILNEEFYLAITDGMGGYDFGEVASKSILEFLLKYDMRDIEVTSNILKNIQKDLYKLSFYHKKYSGMGSVLSGIKVLEKSIIVFNVGDSRTYRVHNGKVNFVTEDDSYVYTLYKKGFNFNKFRYDVGLVYQLPEKQFFCNTVGEEVAFSEKIYSSKKRSIKNMVKSFYNLSTNGRSYHSCT